MKMKFKYISNGILVIISLIGNSCQVQLNSKAKSEFPLGISTGILSGISELVKNGPIGGALMIPVSWRKPKKIAWTQNSHFFFFSTSLSL